jgi:hypothetical protein
MASKQNRHLPARSNFDVWRDDLTPEAIADSKFVTLSCGGCPAYGESCNRYDTKCRTNFLRWARGKASPENGSDEQSTILETADAEAES